MDRFGEFWKEIPGTKGKYFASQLGNIKDNNDNYLKKYVSNSGYYLVNMIIDGKKYIKTVHRLIATTFIENPENKPCVNHKNYDKLENRIFNLEWCTYSENQKHVFKSDKGNNIREKSRERMKKIGIEYAKVNGERLKEFHKMNYNTSNGIKIPNN